MHECLEDADSGDNLSIDELVDTLLQAKLIDELLADDLRERYDDDSTGDVVSLFCRFWRAHALEGSPMNILRELELV